MSKRWKALLLITAALWYIGSAAAATSQDDFWRELDDRLAQICEDFYVMGMSVALVENGEVVHTFCQGWQSDGRTKVAPESLFQVGSISKMVANLGLMQLVEQGAADLDTELGTVLGYEARSPYAPEVPVTLRQVMTHTAGLRDSSDYNRAVEGAPAPLSELFSGQKAWNTFLSGYTPGEKSRYANFDGGLIGVLIERLSGQCFDQYLKERVFAPLGIQAGYQAALLPQDADICDLYQMPSRKLTRSPGLDSLMETAPDPETHYWLTAGKLLISAPDLAKLLILLCDGGVYQNVRLLKESTVEEMLTPQNRRGSVTGQSERGLFLNIITNDLVKGRTLYGHGGKAYGMLCAAYFDPSDRTGAALLTNGCNNRSSYREVGQLSREVFQEWYDALEKAEYQGQNPFAVEP